MGAWAYCSKCEGPLSFATFPEAMAGEQICSRCGTERYVDAEEKMYVCELLMERLQALEDRIKKD